MERCHQGTNVALALERPPSLVQFALMPFVVLLFVFQNRVSLCSPGCPETHSVDLAGLELRDLLASASRVLGLKVCNTTARLSYLFLAAKYNSQLVRKKAGFSNKSVVLGTLSHFSYASIERR